MIRPCILWNSALKYKGEIRKPSSVINMQIEENNRMKKTRKLFKKIRATKGRNGMDLTEVEDVKKRWQEYTEELLKKKDLHDPDNHDSVITLPQARHPGIQSQVGLRKHH